jgi:hypothetical protein
MFLSIALRGDIGCVGVGGLSDAIDGDRRGPNDAMDGDRRGLPEVPLRSDILPILASGTSVMLVQPD